MYCCSKKALYASNLKGMLTQLKCRCHKKLVPYFSPQIENKHALETSLVNEMYFQTETNWKNILSNFFWKVHEMVGQNWNGFLQIEIEFDEESFKEKIQGITIMEVDERQEFIRLLEQYDDFPRLLNVLLEILPPYAKEELMLFICYVCEEYFLLLPDYGFKNDAQFYKAKETIVSRFEKKISPNLGGYLPNISMAEKYPTHQHILQPELMKFFKELIELTVQMLMRVHSTYLKDYKDSLKKGKFDKILS